MVNNPKRGAIGTMNRNAVLTIIAIETMASGVNFTNNTLPDEVSVLFLGYIAVHCFHGTHKLMANTPRKLI